jgi:hypothetical protein
MKTLTEKELHDYFSSIKPDPNAKPIPPLTREDRARFLKFHQLIASGMSVDQADQELYGDQTAS